MTGLLRIGSFLQPALRSSVKEKSKTVCTNAILRASDGSECMKPDKDKKISPKTMADCQRVCMPCCKPARYPPACYFPFVKPECNALQPPRPAYSECVKEPICPERRCDCCPAKVPKCILLKNDKKKC